MAFAALKLLFGLELNYLKMLLKLGKGIQGPQISFQTGRRIIGSKSTGDLFSSILEKNFLRII
jgi:hypothetical protein